MCFLENRRVCLLFCEHLCGAIENCEMLASFKLHLFKSQDIKGVLHVHFTPLLPLKKKVQRTFVPVSYFDKNLREVRTSSKFDCMATKNCQNTGNTFD